MDIFASMPKYTLLVAALLSFCLFSQGQKGKSFTVVQGAIVRGDTSQKQLSLVFTGDEFGEGLQAIANTLQAENVKVGFFFTGRFYRNTAFQPAIQNLQSQGHYLGPHSDNHLLYNDWTKRDSLLVSRDSFSVDLHRNLATMRSLSLPVYPGHLFIPPYEWWNDSIAAWTGAEGLRLFSFTPGMRMAADYTYPEMGTSYKSSEWLVNWLKEVVAASPQKLNSAILLIHAGTDPRRKDKLYDRLKEVIQLLKKNGFAFRRIDELLLKSN